VIGLSRPGKLPADLSYGVYIYAFPIQQLLAAYGHLNLVTAIVGVDLDAIIGQPLRTTTVGAITEENAIQLVGTAQINLEVILQSAGRGEWMSKRVGVAIREGGGDQVSPGRPRRDHLFSERQIRLRRFLRESVRGEEQKVRNNGNPPQGRDLEHKRTYSTNEAV